VTDQRNDKTYAYQQFIDGKELLKDEILSPCEDLSPASKISGKGKGFKRIYL